MFEIQARVDEVLTSKWRQSPVHVNRASELGHPCLRYLVYMRTRYDEIKAPSAHTLALFAEGNIHEVAVIQALQNAGFVITENNRPYEHTALKISGHCDGRIKDTATGEQALIEIKGLNPYTWGDINTWEDMLLATTPFWVTKYVYQLQLYLYLDAIASPDVASDYAIFILKDKNSGRLKEIAMPVVASLQDEALEKARQINACVEEMERLGDDSPLPARITYDESVCLKCPFVTTCKPEISLCGETELIEDEALETLLEEREAAAKASKVYKALDDKVKALFKAKVGNWFIGASWEINTTERKDGVRLVKISRV